MDYQFLPTTKPCRNTLIGQYNTNFNTNMKKLFSLLASFLLAAMVTDAQVAITPASLNLQALFYSNLFDFPLARELT